MRDNTPCRESGLAPRLLLWQEKIGQAIPREPRAGLVRLRGVAVEPKFREAKNGGYYIHGFAASFGPRKAEAEFRGLETGKISTISTAWQSSE